MKGRQNITWPDEERAVSEAREAAPDEQNPETDRKPRHRKRKNEGFFEKRGPALALFANENPRGGHADRNANHERPAGKPEAPQNRVAVNVEHLRDPVRRKARFHAAEGVLHEGGRHHLHDRHHQKEERDGRERRRKHRGGAQVFEFRFHVSSLRLSGRSDRPRGARARASPT